MEGMNQELNQEPKREPDPGPGEETDERENREPNREPKREPDPGPGEEPNREPKREPDPGPGEETQERENRAKTDNRPAVSVSVKGRIKTLNEKSVGSPVKVPEWKQEKLSKYFGRKSPKANKARLKVAETNNQNIQGAQSPLLGVPSEPGSQNRPSKGPGAKPEECGRVWRQEDEKRTKKVLERWPFDPGSKSLGPQQGRSVKRLKGATPKKGNKKVDKDQQKQALALQEWLGNSIGRTSVLRKDPNENQ